MSNAKIGDDVAGDVMRVVTMKVFEMNNDSEVRLSDK